MELEAGEEREQLRTPWSSQFVTPPALRKERGGWGTRRCHACHDAGNEVYLVYCWSDWDVLAKSDAG